MRNPASRVVWLGQFPAPPLHTSQNLSMRSVARMRISTLVVPLVAFLIPHISLGIIAETIVSSPTHERTVPRRANFQSPCYRHPRLLESVLPTN